MPYKSQYPDVPVANENLAERILDALWQHSIARPHGKVLVSATDPKDSWTFREAWVGAHSVAAFLASKGFGHRDIACTVLPNTPVFAIFFLGVGLRGGAISGASALFTDYELERQFRDSGAKVVFTDEGHLSKVLVAAKNAPNITTILVLTKPGSDDSRLPWGVIPFHVVLDTKVNVHMERVKIDPATDICGLPYSSGTTGSPKGVILTHKNYGTMVNQWTWWIKERMFKLNDPVYEYINDTWPLYLPFYHTYGFTMLMTGLLNGVQIVVFEHFVPEVFLSVIQTYKIRFVSAVPPTLVFLAKNPLCDKYDISSLQLILTGAAPAGKDLIDDVRRRHPNIRQLRQGYGMTEISCSCLMPDYATKDKFASSGRLLPNLEHRIMNPETGEEVPLGERGELQVRGPTVMLGYLHRPDATAETIDKDGWLHTGDVACRDEDGDISIVDRIKELIKVKGLQVPPAELEDLLLSHPRIRDAAVVGVKDRESGELPRAYIVRADHDLKESDVDEFVKARVSSYKFLRGGIVFVSEIPKSAAGKILRRFLREQAAKELASKL